MDIKQQFIAITMDDGSVAIMGFVTQGRGSSLPHGAAWVEGTDWWSRPATDENIFEEMGRTAWDGKQPTGYRRITMADIPQDRTYRNALVDDGARLTFDMPKARTIHRDRLRRMRVLLFQANDILLADALVERDEAKRLEAIKTRDALRDVTADPAIDAAQTVDELKLAVPEVLTGASEA